MNGMPRNGTSAPVKRTVWEPERTDNPFVPQLPPPTPLPEWFPEWLDPNRVPAPERVPVPARKGVRA